MSTTYAKGRYHAEVIDQAFQEASTGTMCFLLQLRILGRYDDQGKLQECPRYERTYRQSLGNEIGVRILRGDLKILGVQVVDFMQLEPENSNGVSLIGREIDVVCDHETYKGSPQDRWKIHRTRKKVDVGVLRALSDEFGHLLRDGEGTAAPTPPPVAKPNDSDTPF